MVKLVWRIFTAFPYFLVTHLTDYETLTNVCKNFFTLKLYKHLIK